MAPTALQCRIANFVLQPTAIAITSFRMYQRIRQGNLWWEDAWVSLSAICSILFMTGVELLFNPPADITPATGVASYYMCSQFFYAVIWTARMCILCTLIRISVDRRMRQLLYVAAGAFLVAWAVLLAQVFWTCESDSAWKHAAIRQCELGKKVAIAQVICDVTADAILIFAPLRLVWKASLHRAQKIRITSIFATSLCTTTVSLAHAYYVLQGGGPREALAAVVQDSVSLIVANLNVLVAFFSRISAEEPRASQKATNWGSGPSDILFRRPDQRTGKSTNADLLTVNITTDTIMGGDTAVDHDSKVFRAAVESDYELNQVKVKPYDLQDHKTQYHAV